MWVVFRGIQTENTAEVSGPAEGIEVAAGSAVRLLNVFSAKINATLDNISITLPNYVMSFTYAIKSASFSCWP